MKEREMKLGIIVPPKLLKYNTTSIHYCLPGLVVNDREYAKYFKSKMALGHTVVFDCKSSFWQRGPEDIYVTEDALQLLGPLKPSYVIYPSYMFDVKRTFALIEAYSELFKRLGIDGIPVLEGASKEEVEGCLSKYKNENVAVPNHILGILKEPLKDRFAIYIDNYKEPDELVGIEGGLLVTSLPIRLGLLGRLLSSLKPTPPSLTFTEDIKFSAIIEKNVKDIIKMYDEE